MLHHMARNLCQNYHIFAYARELNIKGVASLTINPLIGSLFSCHKNPSAPSTFRHPLNVLQGLMRFSSKARGSLETGIKHSRATYLYFKVILV